MELTALTRPNLAHENRRQVLADIQSRVHDVLNYSTRGVAAKTEITEDYVLASLATHNQARFALTSSRYRLKPTAMEIRDFHIGKPMTIAQMLDHYDFAA